MKNIVIIGAGGLAREVQHVIEKINHKKNQWNLIGFIDENLEMKRVYTTDGIHLNHKGYEIFNKILDKRLQEIK